MEVIIKDTFWKSFKKMINSEKPWKWQFWVEQYHNFRWAIKNLFKYFRIVTRMRPWDYRYNLEMLQFQTKVLCDNIEKYGNEVDETRLPKIEKMKRFIELAENCIEDNHADRCGWEAGNLNFINTPEGMKIEFDENEKSKKRNSKVLQDSYELAESEWHEMIDILKEARGWWD